MEQLALELELLDRPTIQNSQLTLRSRNTNICILSRHLLNTAILLNKFPAEKLQDYDKYPYAHRLGFIHLIMESAFDSSTATILDVGFLGFFPKSILQCLHQYAHEVAKTGLLSCRKTFKLWYPNRKKILMMKKMQIFRLLIMMMTIQTMPQITTTYCVQINQPLQLIHPLTMVHNTFVMLANAGYLGQKEYLGAPSTVL